MQLCNLKGYTTGGTIHIVINNQIGFTTLPKDSRSTRHCTDLARTFNAPVFHVNAEDPESCIFATHLAVEIRQKFHCDVFIDLNCYRKYGHNEGDEPAYTQPLEYQLIRKKKSIREIYRDALIQKGLLEKNLAETLEAQFKQGLQAELDDVKGTKKDAQPPHPQVAANSEIPQELFLPIKTGVSIELLKELAGKLCEVPADFEPHKKVKSLTEERLKMVSGDPNEKTIDWGMGETLAYATLLCEGKNIRLSGQDSRRGTFSHRHAMWVDQKNAAKYFPLQHLKPGQGDFEVYNSPLSEFAVLGFEYGYSIENPQALVLWEAQFGDFCNGAQVMIDQFITTAEQKWGTHSGLVLLLPHGYEGQGPEHSSARVERFLQLAGDANIQVVNPTTPAQLFHLLRRQALRTIQKPLFVLTPKGLLRHPQCLSSCNEFEKGQFEEILNDPERPRKPTKLLLCSGRIYYDLSAERAKRKSEDIAIVRIEQLYPLNEEKLKRVIQSYNGCQEYIWVQEEPSNMGAWDFIRHFLHDILGEKPGYIGRRRSASPAVGSHALHHHQHEAIINQVFK
jgi:2-oxoglutarate dehydrogenase E1 component